MVKVTFMPQRITVDAPKNTSIYDAALKAGIDVGGVCGGLGKCGKCKVKILEGTVTEPTEWERRVLTEEELKLGYRLACQTRVLSDVSIGIVVKKIMKFAILGYEPKVDLNPIVKVIKIRRCKVTLTSSHASTLESIEEALKKPVNADLDILRKLSEISSDELCLLTRVHENFLEILDVLDKDEKKVYGLAVDVGTTKVAIYIVDLSSGEVVVAEAFENPQVAFGDDVVSRIAYAMEHGVSELHKAVIDGLNRVLQRIYNYRGLDPDDIVDVVVVGNSAMHHLFLGINPRKLGSSPYEVIVRKPLDIDAPKLKINVNPKAKVHFPPLVRGYIGSDSLMGVLLLDLAYRDGTYLFLDIGTNTEVYLTNNGKIVAASTASGPAFEGGHIKCGMKAKEGAIDHIEIDENSLEPKVNIIGDARAEGICGSGIIDTIAEMLKTGIIDHTGRFRIKEHNRIRYGEDGYEYIILRKGEKGAVKDIVITLRDVREIQKAKAAVQTAFRILSKKLNVRREDIDKIYIAGSFGFYLNPESAIIIGLLPEVSLEKIELVGNTAGSGARVLLKNASWRRKAEDLSKRIEYVELAAEPEFQRIYIDSIYFPSGSISVYPETAKKIKCLRR